jgi:hypothetical protein
MGHAGYVQSPDTRAAAGYATRQGICTALARDFPPTPRRRSVAGNSQATGRFTTALLRLELGSPKKGEAGGLKIWNKVSCETNLFLRSRP